MTDPAAERPSLPGRLLVGMTRVIAALPERPLVAAAESIGELWYRLAPARAAQTRANLLRVCEGLAASGRGSARVRRAATDPKALERLVRANFRHTARYYLEVARAGGLDPTSLARIDIETPDEIREALQSGAPSILVGMHFGAIELPAMYIANALGRKVTAPMEAVSDPALQRWFRESRARVGVDIIPLKDARRTLLDRLRRGETVGLVNDRDLLGGGIPTPFFGHPAPIPPGVALLAIETGARVYVAACRRLDGGRYAGQMIPVEAPATGTKRERMVALTTSLARTFEDVLADAPEQWWGAAHPIWPDLAIGDEPAAGEHAGAEG